jgi:hypothetical protein
MSAKKATGAKTDRSDPKKNKSLAIRTVLKKLPNAKANQVAEAVKKEYGHQVNPNMIYMVKTKSNMAADGRVKKSRTKSGGTPMTTAVLWVDAIKVARRLLKSTGSVANATALLKAIDG